MPRTGFFLTVLGVAEGARLRVQKASEPYRQRLDNFQNTQYSGDFEIGGQHIKGIFDTGSFELLVRSTRCQGCAHPTPPYDHKVSKTYEHNGTTVQHVFGSGPCISMQGYDTVKVGPMEAKEQTFWEITKHQIPVLDQAKFAAIVGIGPDFAPTNHEKTLLMSYGVEEFSVCLERESGAPGWLTWGPVTSLKETQMVTVPVAGQLHWAAKMTNVAFGGGKKPALLAKGSNQPVCAGGCAAIVDSGTSLIAAPTPALMQLSEQIGPIHEDCSNLHELPNLHLKLDGKDFELPPHAYVMRIQGAVMQANSVWDVLFFKPQIKKVNMCIPAFMQIDMNSQMGPVWILGMPFFRYYHSSFSRKEKVMKFASAGAKCEPLPYAANSTALLAMGHGRRTEDYEPTDIDIDAIMPPTLSSMLEAHGKTDITI